MSGRPIIPAEDRAWLAADYAMGLAEGEALATAKRLIAEDPPFRTEVAQWSGRLLPLLERVEPVEPPEGLYPAIEKRLPRGANVVDFPSRVRPWKFATAGASALAASLALFILVEPQTRQAPAPAPAASSTPMVARIEGGGNHVVASWDGSQRLLVVPAVVDAVSAGKSHELWIIPEGDKPQSLGLMRTGPTVLPITPRLAAIMKRGASFAISLEPAGGSPTGQPTGPVIASGSLLAA